MKRQFTATVYVIEEKRTLLIKHRKLKKWLPPGGHIESNETPPECAMREVLEETGYTISFVKQENVWVERWNATSFERPYLCLLESIPATAKEEAHEHMDFIYVATPTGYTPPQEEQTCRWFTLDEIEQLSPDEEIFVETVQVLRLLLQEPSIAVK